MAERGFSSPDEDRPSTGRPTPTHRRKQPPASEEDPSQTTAPRRLSFGTPSQHEGDQSWLPKLPRIATILGQSQKRRASEETLLGPGTPDKGAPLKIHEQCQAALKDLAYRPPHPSSLGRDDHANAVPNGGLQNHTQVADMHLCSRTPRSSSLPRSPALSPCSSALGRSRRSSRRLSTEEGGRKKSKLRKKALKWSERILIACLYLGTHALVAYVTVQAVVVVDGSPPSWRLSWGKLESWCTHFNETYTEPILWWTVHAAVDPILALLGAEILFCNLLACFLLSSWGRKFQPEVRWKAPPLAPPSEKEGGHFGYPKVVVQLPMYNEKEVYARAIEAACQLLWPRECLLVQVLDDSTDPECSAGMQRAVQDWQAQGVNVIYKHRPNNKGYKAGNLMEGLQEPYIKDYEFVAVLDADFVPAPEYLLDTVAYLKEHASLALVQARWSFMNTARCQLTKYQHITLTWHFMAEQLVGSFFFDWFGFNGTAGVWRLSAIREAGGWKHDTTVEDMDMAFCTAVAGWNFLFLPEVTVPSELPATYKAYRKQQHRWTCGPVQLVKKRFRSLWAAKLPFAKKCYILLYYVSLHRVVQYVALCFALLLLIPLALLAPRVLPYGLLLHNFLKLTMFFFSPEFAVLFLPYVLFENTMALLKAGSVFVGLLEMKSVSEWVVTRKLGDTVGGSFKLPPGQGVPLTPRSLQPPRPDKKTYTHEVLLGLALLAAGLFTFFFHSSWMLGTFTVLQGTAFLSVGTGGWAFL